MNEHEDCSFNKKKGKKATPLSRSSSYLVFYYRVSGFFLYFPLLTRAVPVRVLEQVSLRNNSMVYLVLLGFPLSWWCFF